ncbi:Response regulator receiver domain-containing protein [Algoriphagus faecimaris]|uniref:Response regulator receiver domain-containing protein n=1 Tax=Algoriphagus faecimaris TaxID=686796 RepID=A0A1G6SPM6_9BACT|nr:response regulator [Algoriphagus faecimaris]SDD18798.1 Response regulator receiver domain-containing protein [Algoriphagus faecimaris]
MRQMHILLIEDNEGDILLIKEALSNRPTVKKISVATDGQQGIDFVTQKGVYIDALQPDLILLDINLPLKNGHEVLHTLKTDSKTKHIPIIVLTTSSSPDDINKSYQSFANLYVTKPVDMDAFDDAISAIESYWSGMVKLPKISA